METIAPGAENPGVILASESTCDSGRGRIRVGISSWSSLPGFYPSGIKAGDRLAWYARFFDVVEVNVSFYRLVPPRTYAQWLDMTPDDFVFDVKAFGELTHDPTPPVETIFTSFRESYAPLRTAGRLGGILFQFPPRFANTASSREYLKRVAHAMADDISIVEFRNHTWLTGESSLATLELLRGLGLAYAIADEPQIPNETPPPLPAVTNSELGYLRLHGRNVDGWLRGGGGVRYDYDYTAAELSDWTVEVSTLAETAREVHVLFNNNARGAGTFNALAFAELTGVARQAQPELPPFQPRLFEELG